MGCLFIAQIGSLIWRYTALLVFRLSPVAAPLANARSDGQRFNLDRVLMSSVAPTLNRSTILDGWRGVSATVTCNKSLNFWSETFATERNNLRDRRGVAQFIKRLIVMFGKRMFTHAAK